jgi:hypothetical protein
MLKCHFPAVVFLCCFLAIASNVGKIAAKFDSAHRAEKIPPGAATTAL